MHCSVQTDRQKLGNRSSNVLRGVYFEFKCYNFLLKGVFGHMLSPSDVGIVVSIAAFQAVDPGSIPGHRSVKQILHKHFAFLSLF